ncbi:hypothetical protein CBS101457_005662 [Exobasidium rhododendri]|nr:hypothetical protein CBS101457_005662 [Exobasidium rhododendri]
MTSRTSEGAASNARSPLNSPLERSSRGRASKKPQDGDYRRGSESNPSFEDDESIDYVEEEEDNDAPARTPAYSSRSNRDRRQSRSIPLSPPSIGSDDDHYHQGDMPQIRSENILGNWHFAPLLIALVPPLGAVLGGGADAWSDAILLVVASFYLYQLLKVPHDMYHAARTRRILNSDAEVDDEDATHEQKRVRLAATTELKRAELISLVALVGSPVAGAWLLHYLMETFSDGNRYLNTFNIRLFMLASGVKPWSHAISLLRKRLLHLQEVVHYPSSRVEAMSRRVGRLEADLASLRKLVALKSDVSLLQDGIDLPLTQLSRTMRRYEKKEENLRMSAEDKFSLVESRLEDLLREVAINAELIEEERRQRQRAVSLPVSIFQALKYAIGQGSSEGSHRDYLYDSSTRNVGSSVPLHITAAAPSPMDSTVNSSKSATPSSQSSNDNGQQQSFSSASSPNHLSSVRGPLTSSHLSSSSSSSGSPLGWTEEGLAYWIFLPINIPKTVFRSAFSFADRRVNDARTYANLASNGAVAAAANSDRLNRIGNNTSTSSSAKARYKQTSSNGQEGTLPRSKDSAYRRRA